MISGKFRRHVCSVVSHNIRIADGSGAAWLWPGASRMATHQSSWQNVKGKITLNKAPNGSFFVGHNRRYKVDLNHVAVPWKCVYGRHSIRSMRFFNGNFIHCRKNCHYCSKRILFILILKRKIGDQIFLSICVMLRKKKFVNIFWWRHFSN